MKLRYYLRGLGIGILVTVVILTIAGLGKNPMTDEEIKNRAKELGMVESTVLSGMNTPETGDGREETASPKPDEGAEETTTPKPTEEPEETGTPAPTEAPMTTEPPASTKEPETTASPAPTKDPEETVTPSPSAEPENTETPDGESVTIVIAAGDSSVSVSKDLEAAGLVESASAYDKYLCDNSYDRRIRVGTYKIPLGATEEEIAMIITGRK